VTNGAEIAGVASVTAGSASALVTEPANSGAADNVATMPLGDLTNGVCNNVTLPLGLVLVADFFRRSWRKKRNPEEEEL
jgi:hypothetical protein